MDQFAYLDPGTGSLFIQSLIGVALASMLFFRTFFANLAFKVKKLFAGKSVKNED